MHSQVRDAQSGGGTTPRETRRAFLSHWPSWLMVSGLVAGYGAFAGIIGRFLFPTNETRHWQFVTDLQHIQPGNSLMYLSPGGQRVVITRIGDAGSADDFIALSSVCPHLGCQVHWEPQNDRFFCPCHNGAFDPEGNPIAGPPKDANQSLPRYPLKVMRRHEEEAGLLYIQVETERLVTNRESPDCSGACRVASCRGAGAEQCVSLAMNFGDGRVDGSNII